MSRKAIARWPLIVSLAALAVGCTLRINSRRDRWEPSFRHPSSIVDGPPRLRYDDGEIERRLAAADERRGRRRGRMPPSVKAPELDDFREVIDALDWCYRHAIPEHGDELLRRLSEQPNDGGRILSFEDPRILDCAELEVTYRRQGVGGAVFITVRRNPGVTGPLAIVFPPGTYARPYISPSDDDRYGDWPPAEAGNRAGTPMEQDLVFLASRIAWLDPGVDAVDVRFPVACGRFNKGAPKDGSTFFLVRFDVTEPMARLSRELCALHDLALDHAAAQMAVWIVRDRLAYDDFRAAWRARGPSMTFETGRVVHEDDAYGAAELILDAGIDPRNLRFYAPSRG